MTAPLRTTLLLLFIEIKIEQSSPATEQNCSESSVTVLV